jgi:hypothetical protein
LVVVVVVYIRSFLLYFLYLFTIQLTFQTSMTKLQQVNKIVIKMLNKHEN